MLKHYSRGDQALHIRSPCAIVVLMRLVVFSYALTTERLDWHTQS